ncbi:hypothetical protein LINPERPRIM_LOCUS5016 [Linum perenne]
MKKVHAILIIPKGMSWLSSHIGRPLNKFVRDGLDIKVCIVKVVNEEIPGSIVVDIGEEEVVEIVIEIPQNPIIQGDSWGKRWVAKEKNSQPNKDGAGPSSSGNLPEARITISGLSPKSVRVENDGMLVGDDEIVYAETIYDETTVEDCYIEMPEMQTNVQPHGVESSVDVQVSVESYDVKCSVVEHVNKPEISTRVIGESGVQHLQKANFVEFLSPVKLLSLKGVITRSTTRRR